MRRYKHKVEDLTRAVGHSLTLPEPAATLLRELPAHIVTTTTTATRTHDGLALPPALAPP